MISPFRAAILVFSIWATAVPLEAVAAEKPPELEIVAELDQRPGNIAVSSEGRIFVTMHPFDNPDYSVMELQDGKLVPWPSEAWSGPRNDKQEGTGSAIGIRASLKGWVYVLDMGAKSAAKTYGPQLSTYNLSTNEFFMGRFIPEAVLTEQSFLQDFALDWVNEDFYIADMGQADLTKPARPAIIVLYGNYFQTARRVLEGHPSLMPSDKPMQAEGRDILVMKDGKPTQIFAALNPITIDPQREWLYYGPMGAGKIYRVKTSLLRDINLSPEQLASFVEVVGDKPESDGMTVDAKGNVYLTGVNGNEIGIIRPGHPYETYIKDDRLDWPDGFSFGPDGMIYVTINQLNRSKALNLGKEEGMKPYLIARFKPIAMGAIGR